MDHGKTKDLPKVHASYHLLITIYKIQNRKKRLKELFVILITFIEQFEGVENSSELESSKSKEVLLTKNLRKKKITGIRQLQLQSEYVNL